MFEPNQDDDPSQEDHGNMYAAPNPASVYLDIDPHFVDMDLTLLREFCPFLLQAADEKDAELSVSLVNDTTIRQLNLQYRGLDKATDVLSFSLREGEPVGQDFALGDIVISVETAQKQAIQFGHDVLDEIMELLFHGMMHLLGHRHDGALIHEWETIESTLISTLQRIGSPYIPKGLVHENRQHERRVS